MQLPPAAVAWVDGEVQLAEITKLLTFPGVRRLVMLTGPAGVGKAEIWKTIHFAA